MKQCNRHMGLAADFVERNRTVSAGPWLTSTLDIDDFS